MNAIRTTAFFILAGSILFIDWFGDKIANGVPGYHADKFPSGWGFYAIPAAFILTMLSALTLITDALVITTRWTTNALQTRKRSRNVVDKR